MTSVRRRSLLATHTSVDPLTVVVYDTLDGTLSFQVADGDTSDGAVDLEAVDQGRLGDHLESGNFLQDTVVHGLIEVDNVLSLE